MTVSLSTIRAMRERGEKVTCLTAYDASFAALLTRAGVDMLMVGDSLGMVIQGQASTLPVTLDQIIYHCQGVRRGAGGALIIADMPFMSYATEEQALHNAARLLQEGKANLVKMEGGGRLSGIVHTLSEQGIPVCAHLGLQPQSVNKIGGYRVQGKEDGSAQRIVDDALQLQEAGADMLVLECVPAALAESITKKLNITVIGIGAGQGCHGQVLVSYDMLGLSTMPLPRFVRNFMQGCDSIECAVRAYVQAVKSGLFPAPEHGY